MSTAAQSNLDVIVRGVDQLSPELAKMESKVIRVVGAIGASLAALRTISFPITASAQFEREMANVAKTTNFTRLEMQRLSKDILNLSLTLSTSAEDLAKVAAAAGQQGLGREGVDGILKFTDSVARMASVLDLEAGEAATQVGKIANIFKVPFNELERVVAAFNQTSNNTTASGKELLDVVRRIGDASGTINLQQSIGLAASALDFGVSPEQAGTNLSKVFATMLSKSDEFGRRLGMSSQAWADLVSKNGIEGFKKVLDYLRSRTVAKQQDDIAKLFGGGARGGSLINKYIQDANNALLDRDLKQAEVGYAQGTSALREQATVLNTVTEQTKILFNTIKKDAIEAGDQLRSGLLFHIRELTQVMQQPGTQQFINSLVGALGDVMDIIGRVATTVSGLNVNWENFLKLAKAFIAFKIADVVAGALGKLPGIQATLQTMADTAASTGSKMSAATKGNAAEVSEVRKAWQQVKAAVGEYRDQLGAAQRATQQQALATYDLARAQGKLAEAEKEMNTLEGPALAADSINAKAAARTGNAKTNLAQTRDAQAGQALQTYNAMNAKLEAAEIEHQARLTEIQETYEQRRQAAIALGRNKAGQAARAEADEYLATATANEDKRFNRSLASTRTYYQRKLATEVEGYEASLAQQENYLAQMEQREAKVRDRMAARVTKFEGAQTAYGAAGVAVNDAQDVAVVAASANAGATAMQKLALAVTAVRAGLQLVARVALGAFFWVTILYSVADALGLIDKAGEWFRSLADSIGLTSKAMRDKEVHDAALLQATREQTAALQEQVEAYNKLKDAGKFSKDLADAYAHRAGGASDTAERTSAHEALNTAAAGASTEFEQLNNQVKQKGSKEHVLELDAKIRSAEADIVRLQDEQLKKAQQLQALKEARSADPLAGIDPSLLAQQALAERQLKTLSADLDAARENLKGLKLSFDTSAQMMNGGFGEALKTTAGNVKEVAGAFAQLYSEKSANLAQQYFPELINNIKLADEASKRYQETLNKQKQFESSDEKDNEAKAALIAKEVSDAQQQVEEANARVSAAKANLHKVINDTIASGTVTEQTQLNALKLLDSIVERSSAFLQNELKGIGLAKLFGLQLTAAADTQDPRKPSSGTDDSAGAKAEGQKNREAKARIKLENARIEAETSLRREGNDQLLAEDQRLYDRGLVALQKYYTDRERIQLQQNSDEIAARRRELAEVQKEIQNVDPNDNAARLEYQAQAVKLQGEIAVLQKHRAAISADNTEALRQAREAFQDRVTQEANRAFAGLALTQSDKEAFKSALDEQLAQYRVFLAQLDTETQAALAKGDTVTAARLQTIASAVKAELSAAAFEQALQGINNEVAQATTALSQYQQKLSILRGEGAMTSLEAEAAYNEAIKQSLVLLQQKLEREEALLAYYKSQGTAGAELYARESQAVNDTRLQIAQLGAQANQTAKEFNQAITDDVASALTNLQPTIHSLKDTVMGFIRDIANQMKAALAKDLAEQFIGKITGHDSSKGPGGWWQKLIMGGKDTADVGATTQSIAGGALGGPDGTAMNPVHTVVDSNPFAVGTPGGTQPQGLGGVATELGLGTQQGLPSNPLGVMGTPGATPATPIYTQDVGNGGLGSGSGLASAAGGVGSARISPDAKAITSAVTTTGSQQIQSGGDNFEWSTGMTVSAMGVVAGAVNGNKSQMITSLLMLGAQIVSAIWGAQAAATMTTAAASAKTAHTGGVIGATSLRRRNIGAGTFAHATRYHTGGVVGLQPNEVPIVAKRGEEVLTESDPRHRNNGAGAGQGHGGPVQVSQTLVFDTQAAAKAILTGENLMTAIRPNVKAMRTLLGVKS